MAFPNTRASAFGRLIDTTTAEVYEFNWNPEEIDEAVQATYARQAIPGLSHKRSQFLNTENREIEFTLVVDGLAHGGPMAVEAARRFLLSTMYPRASRRVEGAGAPKMLLILPGSFRAKGFIDNVKIGHKLFYRDMKTRRFEAAIKFLEEPDKRLTSSDIRNTVLSNRQIGNFVDYRNLPTTSSGVSTSSTLGNVE